MSDRTVLLVCPHFPPSTLAGVHRGRHLAKHLPSVGWRPIVICVDERRHTESLDLGLLALVPAELELIKTDALPARLTRLGGVGDIGIRGFPYLRAAIARAITKHDPDVVFITGSPFYPMLLSGWVSRRFGKPVVLDFQDPWVSGWGATQPVLSKAGLSHRLAVFLEPRALSHADFVTSVSNIQNAEMAARYPWLDASRMEAIPIGGDPDDFERLKEAVANGGIDLDPSRLEFSYVGTALPRADALFEALFTAVGLLQRSRPELRPRLRLNFIGTSNQPRDGAAPQLEALARRAGVADLVRERPGRVPYLQALSLLANSHALLLIGSDEPHYTASKIYPALLSGRPFLSLFHNASSAHAVLSAAGGGCSFSFESPADLSRLVPAISAALGELAVAPESAGKPNPEWIAQYTARAVARRFAEVFEAVRAPT